jgi:hypothetical protein
MTWSMRITGLSAAERAAQRGAQRMRGAIDRATAQEAQLLRRVIVQGLRDQAPGGKAIRPLSPMTIALRKLPRKSSKSGAARRGSTKSLINNGDLLGSVNDRRAGYAWHTVGVHRGERGRDGRDLVNIAAIHEYGTRKYTITVTPKMHRFSIFLMMQGVLKAPWPVGKVLQHQVPARPFLRPGYNQWGEDADERFLARVARGIGDRELISQMRFASEVGGNREEIE